MKQIDWSMIVFVGISLVHDYWFIWGLPRVYFWEVKQQTRLDDMENNEDIA